LRWRLFRRYLHRLLCRTSLRWRLFNCTGCSAEGCFIALAALPRFSIALDVLGHGRLWYPGGALGARLAPVVLCVSGITPQSSVPMMVPNTHSSCSVSTDCFWTSVSVVTPQSFWASVPAVVTHKVSGPLCPWSRVSQSKYTGVEMCQFTHQAYTGPLCSTPVTPQRPWASVSVVTPHHWNGTAPHRRIQVLFHSSPVNIHVLPSLPACAPQSPVPGTHYAPFLRTVSGPLCLWNPTKFRSAGPTRLFRFCSIAPQLTCIIASMLPA
jgi:hypothetical protein